MKSLSGHLLIASPELRDPNFAHSVVLIVRDNDEGTFGLILNRVTNLSLRQAWKQVSGSECQSAEPLRLGGPVQGPLMALHTQPALGEMEPVGSVYFTADPDNLRELVETTDEHQRFFVGFSGWGPGQLEGEMGEGAWIALPARSEHVFAATDELWKKAMREAADVQLIEALRIKHVPDNPRLN